ncbi:MAG: rhodanese-like domain-containing protein [Pirellulales bacterium]
MNAPSPAPVPWEIDVRSVQQLLESGADFVLLDCRENSEYQTVHIAGARLLPMSEMPQRVGELDGDRQRHIVVHCHHGGRSLRVTQWLRSQGFSRVQSMAGGIDAWSLEIDPRLPRY